jgi:NAD(P)H dehydrogenase (quinone)
MCFPSKRQNDNFSSSEGKSETDKKRPTPVATSSESPPPPTHTTKIQPTDKMSPPKVAIVIYSMYGHVAKRMFIIIYALICTHYSQCIVAEAEKAGIESAGGKVEIFQYVN